MHLKFFIYYLVTRKRRRAIESINEKDKRIKELEEENRVLREKLKEEHQKPFKAYKKEEKSLNKEPSRRGAPVGHQGITRKKPEKIDEYKDIRADTCPICGSPDIRDSGKFEEHIIEDIEIKKAKTICYRKHYPYCPHCKKVIGIKGDLELPKVYIGPVARAVAGHLHYVIGIPYGKISSLFYDLFGLELTKGALIGFDKKTCENRRPFYELIEEKVRFSQVIHVDETGWRLDGVHMWLWDFVNQGLAFYKIDESRGSRVVKGVLWWYFDI